MTRILIAEADVLIAAFLVKGVDIYGLDATVTDDGREALVLASSGAFDLLVVDCRLPDRQVLTTVRYWEEPRLPIIVLGGNRRPAETAAEFGVSENDVLAKPFRVRQLVARIAEHLGLPEVEDPSVLHMGRASLDLRSRELTLGRTTLTLTEVESALAAAFFRHPGKTITGDELLRERETETSWPVTVSLDKELNELNRRLGRELIRTVHRTGYRLDLIEENGSPT